MDCSARKSLKKYSGENVKKKEKFRKLKMLVKIIKTTKLVLLS